MVTILECGDCHKVILDVGRHDRLTGHKMYQAIGTTEIGILRNGGY